MRAFIFQAQHPHSKRIVQQTIQAQDRHAALAAFRAFLFRDGFGESADKVDVIDGQLVYALEFEDTTPTEQHQGEPVAWLRDDGDGCLELTTAGDGIGFPVYTHADAGEVERLRKERDRAKPLLKDAWATIDTLRAQLAEGESLAARLNAEAERHARAVSKRDALLVRIAEYAPKGICAPTALQGFAIEAKRMLSASAEPSATKCECNMRTALVGDGCEVCNPGLADELSAPVERVPGLSPAFAMPYGRVPAPNAEQLLRLQRMSSVPGMAMVDAEIYRDEPYQQRTALVQRLIQDHLAATDTAVRAALAKALGRETLTNEDVKNDPELRARITQQVYVRTGLTRWLLDGKVVLEVAQ